MDLSPLKLILLVGAAQDAILGLLLATRSFNRVANRILALLLFLLSIHLLLDAFDSREFFMRFPHLSHITWLLPALYGSPSDPAGVSLRSGLNSKAIFNAIFRKKTGLTPS